jgi:ketosteroid isomerase-like protein
MISNQEKTELAQKFLSGLRSSDWNLLKSLMTEDVVWSLPGNSRISGDAQGADAVVLRAQRIVDYGMNFTLKNILLGLHGVALSLHNTARRGDLVFDLHLATVFTLRDGKISAINTYMSDVDMVDAFFVPI